METNIVVDTELWIIATVERRGSGEGTSIPGCDSVRIYSHALYINTFLSRSRFSAPDLVRRKQWYLETPIPISYPRNSQHPYSTHADPKNKSCSTYGAALTDETNVEISHPDTSSNLIIRVPIP